MDGLPSLAPPDRTRWLRQLFVGLGVVLALFCAARFWQRGQPAPQAELTPREAPTAVLESSELAADSAPAAEPAQLDLPTVAPATYLADDLDHFRATAASYAALADEFDRESGADEASDRDPIADSPSLPLAPEPTSVLTETDDSFWRIAQRRYGSPAYFRALFEYNRGRFPRPDQLPAGERVDTPPREQLDELYPEWRPAAAP